MISERQSQTEDNLRATHFFCIRVQDEEVRRKAALVQEHVVLEDPTLRSCAMPGELLHVTLAMVKLDTTQAIQNAGNLLNLSTGKSEGGVRFPVSLKVNSCEGSQHV